MQKAVIILPTYNESENIGPLVPMVFDVASSMSDIELSVLVVDDTSPDGTAEIVRSLQTIFPNLHLLMGKKEGLGRAYIRGMKYATRVLGADIVMEMDADLSHDPAMIPAMVQEILSNRADFVIGSRYVPGGSIPQQWTLFRKLNSFFGNLVARLIIGLYGIHDCTGGFRAIRTSVLEAAQLDGIPVAGYAFQVSLLQRASLVGARIIELPIAFRDRTLGNSKMRLEDITEFILKSFLLRAHSAVVRYGLYAFITALATITTVVIWFSNNKLAASVSLASIVLFVQGLWNLWLLINAWENPYSKNSVAAPSDYAEPHYSFTALLPARHEEKVISETIRALNGMDYPEHLKQVLVIVRFDDTATIRAAQQTILAIGKPNIELVIAGGQPINKPKSLNIGLKEATGDVVVPFDAEDTPHPDLYKIVNTVMLRDEVDVVQSGVQLMNFESNWYSVYNVLEYFFWFKSVLPYFARQGCVPLGGNTVFFKRSWLGRVKGWDEQCLTEDADVGLKLSQAGAKISVMYEERYVTQEETPLTLAAFIKQRTRWHQGFMQIVGKFGWRKFLSLKQQLLSLYLLIWPEIQAILFVYALVSVFVLSFIKLPVVVTMLALLPLYLLIALFVICVAGMYQFCKSYNRPFTFGLVIKMLIAFYPFQILLGISAMRAVFRLLKGNRTWEKTQHVGAHRPELQTVQVPLE